MNRDARIELYVDKKDKWRWRFVSAGNSAVLGGPQQGYARLGGAVRNLELVVDPHLRGIPVYRELADGSFELVG